MNRSIKLFGAIVAVFLVSCSSTSLDGIWVDPEFVGGDMDNILVLGIAENEGNRRAYESAVVSKLQEKGTSATPSFTILPNAAAIDKDIVEAAVAGKDFDGFLVTRLLRVDESTTYVPGSTYVVPNSYYYGFYGYYSTSYAMVSEPGYYQENTTVVLETNLYDAATEKLIWSGVSKSYNPSGASQVIQELSSLVVDDLKSRGLIGNAK